MKVNSNTIINGLTGDEINSICSFIESMEKLTLMEKSKN